MLNFLLQGNQKQIVGLALTPGIGLEAVVLDNKSGKTIVNYGRKRVDYNFSQREIDKYPEFKAAFSELMDELKVSSQALVYIVLPNVYFNFIELAPSLDDAQVKTAVLSEAEEFYIFKREEPVSGWADVSDPQSGTRKIAYSSIQRNAIEELKEMAADLGFSLAGIEGSYSATLRGLYITGALDDVILEQAPWTAMLIGTNSYTLFQFRGSILLNCNEVPLAIRSFSADARTAPRARRHAHARRAAQGASGEAHGRLHAGTGEGVRGRRLPGQDADDGLRPVGRRPCGPHRTGGPRAGDARGASGERRGEDGGVPP